MSDEHVSEVVGPDSVPFNEVTDLWNKTPPSYATIREIDFELTDPDNMDGLRFFFSKWHNDYTLGSGGIQELINTIVQGSFVFDNQSEPTLEEPYLSPLSLKNTDLRYVVYVLSKKNWQVSRLGRPLTVGQKTHGPKNDVYFDAKRAWATGAGGCDQGTPFGADPSLARDGAKVLYFIADGSKARSASGNNYMHPINLHIDLKLPGSRYMPIIIDPDIRFPGGSDD